MVQRVDAEPAPTAHPGDPFEAMVGLEVTELSAELARGRLPARPELTHDAGAIHRGVLTAVAQILVSKASTAALAVEGTRGLTLSNQTTFLRPLSGGEVRALALRRHRGRTTWVWEVEISDAHGRLCAISRVTVAVVA
jgi:1,4-dihydroxy-2-naphthoyl-CoA hydrolase